LLEKTVDGKSFEEALKDLELTSLSSDDDDDELLDDVPEMDVGK
jgi:hypothetical protein